MSKAKAKPNTKGVKAQLPPDHALLRTCIGYTVAMSAAFAVSNADPDPNGKNSGGAMHRALRRADRWLAEAAQIPATNAAGVVAKARVAKIVVGDDVEVGGTYTDESAAFLMSFAADVERVAMPLVDAEWRASKGGAA